jgi:hypothetical protein
MQYDEVYIGTPEERMAGAHPDKAGTPAGDVGHLAGSRDVLDGPIKSKDAIEGV